MTSTAKTFVIGLLLLLAAGSIIGWFYGHTERGLLVAALLALAWQVQHLLAFSTALRNNNFDLFRSGEGVWQEIFSLFSYERQRAERHKQRYRQLLKEVRKSTDAMPDGAVIVDSDNEIVACNKAAKAIAGLKPKKDRGQRVDNILRDPALTKLLHSGDFKRTVEIQSPVHADIWLSCRVVPYGADQKLLFLRDVTDRMRLSRTRRDFVANASHELRSPLTVISGYLDSLAEDRDIPVTWQQPVRQMQQEARRMNQIVAELLELSRLESAGSAHSDELVDIGDLLDAAKKSSYKAGVTADIEVIVGSTARLRGSGSEIKSLITNLVSNAVRHTALGEKITLSWHSDSRGAGLVVEDTGEGISPEHLPRLTERFFRIDRGRTREDGGIGLGLAIVKHVLSRHDAELEIASQPGEGSTFSCHFPPQRIAAEPPIPMKNERAKS